MKRLLAYTLFLLVTITLILYLSFNIIGMHAEHLVGMVVGGYARFTNLYVKSTFLELAAEPTVQKLDEKSCDVLRTKWEASQGFLAVLALGDAQGNALCTADPSVTLPLPTMSDRLYYQRVRSATDMVVGDYAVSKTTGKQVIHFAYPLRSQSGELRGFIMAAVNLDWFADPIVASYFHGRSVDIMSIDSTGKLLYRYPSDTLSLGREVLTPQIASVVLSGDSHYRLMKGYDGVYRVYAFENVPIGTPVDNVFMVGISIAPFVPLLILLGILSIGSFLGFWRHVVLNIAPVARLKK